MADVVRKQYPKLVGKVVIERYIYFKHIYIEYMVMIKQSLQRLEELLEALWVSELHYDQTNETPFVSDTTLGALRMTILSVIDVSNHLLEIGYEFVLTEKLNQDCVEVCSLHQT